jgi:hypothetical protein
MPESEYNGIAGTATYHCNGKAFGPFKLSVYDYHAIGRAIQEAKCEGAAKAGVAMKERVEAAIQETLNRF